MKFFSTQCSDGAFNFGALALRVTFGLLLLINHGLDKITNFSKHEYDFYNFLHIGHRPSLMLCIFAEVVCAGFIVLGLFSRLASLVLVINFAVASFLAMKGADLAHRELPLLYLSVFVALLLAGPGKYSVDGAMGK